MFSEFAYSRTMQLILMFIAFLHSFILMYFVAKLTLRIYGEGASIKQKSLFAFLTGTMMQSAWSYMFYFIGGMVSFTKVQSLLITSPNPAFALLYCYLGIKILGLSPKRSIELMGHLYLYFMIVNVLNRFAGSLLFIQDPGRFNYLMDALRLFINLLISLSIYYTLCRFLDRHTEWLTVTKAVTFATPGRDIIAFFLKTCFVYICVVFIPMMVPSFPVANGIILVILVLFFISTLLYNFNDHMKADIRNKDAYIHSLIKTSDEFRAVKHDFYNVLQTYSGYFAMEDLDACRKYHESLIATTTKAGDMLNLSIWMRENPTMVSLLMHKQERAAQAGVQLDISIKCSLTGLPIDEVDLSRVLACLLDNAIEAAEESEQKRVFVTIEKKTVSSRIIIITNSSPEPLNIPVMFVHGKTSKAGHQGIGLNNIRKIIDAYSNCTFQLNTFDKEVTAYVELSQS